MCRNRCKSARDVLAIEFVLRMIVIDAKALGGTARD